MTLTVLLWLLVAAPPEGTRQVQLFDTAVLGRSVADGPALLLPKSQGQTEPATVHVDIACGRYYSALVGYWPFVSFDEVKESLDREFEGYEKRVIDDSRAIWFVADREPRFNVVLSKDQDSGACKVLYHSEAPPPIQAYTMSVVPAEERGWMREFNPRLPSAMEAHTEQFADALEGYCAERGLKAKSQGGGAVEQGDEPVNPQGSQR